MSMLCIFHPYTVNQFLMNQMDHILQTSKPQSFTGKSHGCTGLCNQSHDMRASGKISDSRAIFMMDIGFNHTMSEDLGVFTVSNGRAS